MPKHIFISGSNDYFVTTWKTDNAGTSSNDQITIPMVGGPYDVDWGDGTTSSSVSNSQTHTYPAPGTYTVKIRSTNPLSIFFNNGGDRRKILSVDNWGSIAWSTFISAFFGCSNLDVLASDSPDISTCTALINMFTNCTSLSIANNINNWDVSNIQQMGSVFYGCTSFNKPLSNRNTSNVVQMGTMFTLSAFNQDISSWDVSNVTNMTSMFSYSSFNQDISSRDVSNVTNMYGMFFVSPFNQDISSWDVSNVTTMELMFRSTPFNQDISSWDVSNVTTMEFMFGPGSSLSTANYNALLIGWSALTLQNGVTLDMGSAQYNAGAPATARSNIITNFSWTINDGGVI